MYKEVLLKLSEDSIDKDGDFTCMFCIYDPKKCNLVPDSKSCLNKFRSLEPIDY